MRWAGWLCCRIITSKCRCGEFVKFHATGKVPLNHQHAQRLPKRVCGFFINLLVCATGPAKTLMFGTACLRFSRIKTHTQRRTNTARFFTVMQRQIAHSMLRDFTHSVEDVGRAADICSCVTELFKLSRIECRLATDIQDAPVTFTAYNALVCTTRQKLCKQ